MNEIIQKDYLTIRLSEPIIIKIGQHQTNSVESETFKVKQFQVNTSRKNKHLAFSQQ